MRCTLGGQLAMASPLQVKATNAANPATAFAPVETPVTLLTWPGPVGSDSVLVTFKQTDKLDSALFSQFFKC